MKNYVPYLAVGAFGLLVLGFILTAGFLQNRAAPTAQRIAAGGRLSEQQVLARRRGAMGTAAIAATTAQ